MESPSYGGIIQKYRACLPVGKGTTVVSLLEGNTPLVCAPRLARWLELPEDALLLKIEGMNPTGSFKDRGMTVAVSKALEAGARGILCASTGNTAASAAAYAARAGLRCAVLLPEGGVAAGKLAAALMHGASVIALRGSFDAALALAQRVAQEDGWTLVNSVNPSRIQGQKTAAFEIIEALGRAPDFQFMPVGNAGNITAYWLGYREWHAALKKGLPKMMGVQAKGAAPLVLGRPVAHPKTVASAIRIGRPASWAAALKAKEESGGMIAAVSDAEILSAWRRLAREEGVFCEPASAAGVAGLIRFARGGGFHRMDASKRKALRIVCILTGHGLKDPDAPAALRFRRRTVDPDLRAVSSALNALK
ncbi:MAG: threonine synthase [Elusimicrobia bacterium]|nr:threonine synthase [Elusimicrobiota bacterium]